MGETRPTCVEKHKISDTQVVPSYRTAERRLTRRCTADTYANRSMQNILDEAAAVEPVYGRLAAIPVTYADQTKCLFLNSRERWRRSRISGEIRGQRQVSRFVHRFRLSLRLDSARRKNGGCGQSCGSRPRLASAVDFEES